jgi:hypothetical protein
MWCTALREAGVLQQADPTTLKQIGCKLLEHSALLLLLSLLLPVVVVVLLLLLLLLKCLLARSSAHLLGSLLAGLLCCVQS